MSEIRRILIVDDDFQANGKTDTLFSNCGVPVEVRIARNKNQALAVLDDWFAQGHRPNVVTIDENSVFMNNVVSDVGADSSLKSLDKTAGIEVLSAVISRCEAEGKNYVPDQFFMHSQDPINYPPKCDYPLGTLYTEELYCISWWGDLEERGNLHVDGDIPNNASLEEQRRLKAKSYMFSPPASLLRAYCNQNWGTNFILDEDAYEEVYVRPERLKLNELVRMYDSQLISLETLFSYYEPQKRAFEERVILNGKPKMSGVQFADSAGDSMSGRLAFTHADINQLKQEHPQDKIILFANEYTTEIGALLPLVDGFILIGKGREHLKTLAENNNKACVLNYTPIEQSAEFRIGHKSVSYSGIFNATAKPTGIHDLDCGHIVTLDTVEGRVYPAELPLKSSMDVDKTCVERFMELANTVRAYGNTKIHANADNETAIAKALKDGAEAIGLVRTEHMLMFEGRRPYYLKLALLSKDKDEVSKALSKLKALHIEDLQQIFQQGATTPIKVRLFDAPASEFLTDAECAQLRAVVGKDNMRGAQLAAQKPGFYQMQIESIFAAAELSAHGGHVEVMVPLIRSVDEVLKYKESVAAAARLAELPYEYGVMIETLDAYDKIEEIAAHVDFISIGSGDFMSEIMGGVPRDEYEAIDEWKIANGITVNPFDYMTPPLAEKVIDLVNRAREANPNIKISICGQQVGKDYQTIKLATELGMDAVSVPARALKQVQVDMAHVIATSHEMDLQETPQKHVQPARDLK